MQIHLDPLGGVAGDMFVAAILDAWPGLEPLALAAIRASGLPEAIAVTCPRFDDGTLTGRRFEVARAGDPDGHTSWKTIRARLEAAALAPAVRDRALAIFGHLADAEAAVHGVERDDVTFHEVGAIDSIADIVAAAALIEELGADGWSIGTLPLGRGRVQSAHGTLPIPAPATVRLLEGFVVVDDGLEGERVTPTGAAILRHLQPGFGTPPVPLRLTRHGHGFGARRFYQVPNVLRLLAFDPVDGAGGPVRDRVGVIRFEIDDQTGEDLALGLERLRALPGVLDVLQAAAVGKKGRLVVQVQILTRPDVVDAIADRCFDETTTLGLRIGHEARRVLERTTTSTGGGIRVKRAGRPGGVTAKADIDDLAGVGGRAARQQTRSRAERAALRDRGRDD